MANVRRGNRALRWLLSEERTLRSLAIITAWAVASEGLTGSDARQSDRKGVVRLVTGRELSFLYKGRGLRRPQQLERRSVEVCPAEDATA
jgi:hypothetical protein